MNTTPLSTTFQLKSITSLAGIFSSRMLGLFLILPIFSLYTHQLPGATATLMGIALGIYGLTQAIFQIPLATLSDKIGRKPVILFGLAIFIVGSIVAALSDSIYGIIVGRALQGAGAIGSTTIALLADLTTAENRSKAMALIGLSIGASFAIAMVAGPVLNAWIGLSGIFWTTAMLGVLSIGLLLTCVPRPPKVMFHPDTEASTSLLKDLLLKPALLRLNMGIFSLHFLLTASFVVIPNLLVETRKVSEESIWMVYLPMFLVAFIAVMPCIILAEKRRFVKAAFLIAIFLLALTQISLWYFHTSVFHIAVILTVFFTAFTFLESMLPSLISKIAPAKAKGTAMGIYSTSQFLGIFAGGSLGGSLFYLYGLSGVLISGAILAIAWFFVALTMSQPPYLNTIMVSTAHLTETQNHELYRLLRHLPGMAEIAAVPEEKILYLKVDKQRFDKVRFDAVVERFRK